MGSQSLTSQCLRSSKGDSVSPPTHRDEHVLQCSPHTSDVIEVTPTVPTLMPASDALLPPQSLIMVDKQLEVACDEVAPAAPTAPISYPTAPSTNTAMGADSPLTVCPSHPTSPIHGDDKNMSTGCKRKADEEVSMDIARKKPASNQTKGPPSVPQHKQPSHGRSKVPDGDLVTPGQLSKADTVMEDIE